MSIQSLHTTLEAGSVIRYHAVPSCHNRLQNVGQHSWNVIILLMYLTEMQCSRQLLMEAALHDTGEIITGDVPYTMKRDHPELKKMLALIELNAREQHTISGKVGLTTHEEALLKVCDTLDGFIFCALHETRSGPVVDRWHQAYRNSRDKFAAILGEAQWAKADAVFLHHGGTLHERGVSTPFAKIQST